MEITMAVFAESASMRESGVLDLHGIFRILATPRVPFTQSVMSLVLTFRAGPGEKGIAKEIQLHIVDEDGKAVAPAQTSLIVTPTESHGLEPEVDHVFDLMGLTFPRFGKYYFDVLINGDSKRRLDLLITSPKNGFHGSEYLV